jgi:MFS transporter, UMF1 family
MLALATKAVGDHGVLIRVGPLELRADAYPSAMITVAALVQFLVLPFLGSWADQRGSAQRWLAGACGAGSLACIGLALTTDRAWLAAGLLFVFGSLTGGVSDLVWNGLLPELAPVQVRHAVSSRATAVGYLGAGAILAIDLVLVQARSSIGLGEAMAVRICFVTAAAWWVGFGLPALRHLPNRHLPNRHLTDRRLADVRGSRPGEPSAHVGRRLQDDLRQLRTMPQAWRFVGAYLCFADATSAVLALASTYVTHQLFHDHTVKATPFLFELILLVQFVAVAGAVGFNRLARRLGAKQALLWCLTLWCAAVVFAYAVLDNKTEAVVAGVAMGIALGGTVALSRSLFANMIPAGREATWFSLFEVCSQGTAWIAPLLFTIVVDITGSFRQAMLSLVLLFGLGLFLLWRTDPDEAAREALAINARESLGG